MEAEALLRKGSASPPQCLASEGSPVRLTATHKMGIAALIMAGSVFLSRLMGLVRDKVVSWQFGAGA